MDVTTIDVLVDIRAGVYWLVALVAICAVAVTTRAYFQVKGRVAQEIEKDFKQRAATLFEKGNTEELLAHCREKLADKPNHAYALWYLAKAHYERQEHSEARTQFVRLAEVEPSWDEGHVQPYLRAMSQQHTAEANR